MIQIKEGSKIGIVACSDAYQPSYQPKLDKLCQRIVQLGWIPVLSERIYSNHSVFSGTGKERAEALMKFFYDDEISAIFDLSGGNAANEVIPWLDYDFIRTHPKPMFGYSDLSCVLNAIYAKTGVTTYLYQIRNLMYDYSREQEQWLRESFMDEKNSLFEFPVQFLQQETMEGIVIGGNIRCFLKLAGTPYFPDVKGKILALESYSGKSAAIVSMLTQLKLMGVLDEVNGILLGTFTELQLSVKEPSIDELILRVVEREDLPIAKTKWFGHGTDSKGLRIGERIRINS